MMATYDKDDKHPTNRTEEKVEATISQMAETAIKLKWSDEDLAGRIVGLLILDEGNLNKYQRTIELAVRIIRAVEEKRMEHKIAPDNFIFDHKIAMTAGMAQWQASLERQDLTPRERVQGALATYERQLYALALLRETQGRIADEKRADGQEA